MINKLIKSSLKNRLWPLVFFIGLACFGVWSLPKLPIDAVPDITSVQVVVNTKTGALDPEQIEKTVTQYIEIEMSGIPFVEDVRSLSKYGLSQVSVIFKEGTNIYWARQQVAERLQSVQGTLPSTVTPELAPITTGLGEVLMYVVLPKPGSALSAETEEDRLRYLRTIQETLIRPFLKSKVPNVADIDTTGGFKKEIHIDLETKKLQRYGISIESLTTQLERLGESAGGGYIERDGSQIIVRSRGAVTSIEQIQNITIKLDVSGNPIRLKDLGQVREDHAQRLGASTYEGKEAVLGTVLMLNGANSREVATLSEHALTQIPLPEDVVIKVVYTRSFLVNATIKTVLKNLAEGAALVMVVLLLILGNLRAAVIVASIIPIAMLMAVTGMKPLGISANLMSLGAIDFGLLVDGGIVVIETLLRHMNEAVRPLTSVEKRQLIWKSCKEVMAPVTLGLLLIMVVYVPILSLEGVEGKLFKPMAITVLLAIGSALLVTLFLIPVLSSFMLKASPHKKETWFFRALQSFFVPLIEFGFKFPKLVFGGAIGVCVLSGALFVQLGSDFMPPLDEGDIVINMVRNSRVSIDRSVMIQKESDAQIMKFPGIEAVFSRMGTPESATDPMGPHLSDTFVILKKDHSTWPQENGKTITKDRFFELIKASVERLPYEQELSQTQPIEMRFNEILEGSRADVSLRIFGPELTQLSMLSDQAVALLSEIKGVEIELDALTALRKSTVLNIEPNSDALIQYGLHLNDVHMIVETALSGKRVGSFYSKNWRYPIVVRLTESERNSTAILEQLPLGLPTGGYLPLSRVATLTEDEQVTTISHNNGRRYAGIAINLDGRDVQSVVAEAQEKLGTELKIPKEYTLEWGGQFENLQSSRKRMMVIIPVMLLVLFILVGGYLKSIRLALIVLASIPFAMTGGIISLWLRGLPLTVSASIGFIALMGIALLNALVLIEYVEHLIKSGINQADAVKKAVFTRLKPVLSTALVASLGFIPMAINTGMGSEIQRPLATVVIGGLITSTLLTLVVIPQLLRRKG